MANTWFKFYGGEYLSDPKIERLSLVERNCWITLLCLASMQDTGIVKFLTVESLLNKSGIHFDPYYPDEWEKGLNVLIKFKNLKMIETNDDGDIIIINWDKRQEKYLTNAERQAKHREKAKEINDSNKKVTTNVTKVTLEENRIEENNSTSSKEEDATKILKSEEDKYFKEILSIFEEVGISIPNTIFRNKTERKAGVELYKKKGIEKVRNILEYCMENKVFYNFTTPNKLLTNYEAIRLSKINKDKK